MTDLSKLKWTDTSTADPIEKARRVLNHLIEPDGAFFFQDGFPRSNDIAMNAASVLAVLNALSASIADTAKPFQERVQPWMLECFGAEISADRIERNHRFFEEATELVQANGMTRSEAHQLVDYTFDRPVGELHQEIGGVMVTLAALCLANDLDMHEAAETELARIWTKVEAIRAKQAAKPKHSPLPEHVTHASIADTASLSDAQIDWIVQSARAFSYDEIRAKIGKVREASIADTAGAKAQDKNVESRIDEAMTQAQVFASACSLIDGPFGGTDDSLENAEVERRALRALIADLLSAATPASSVAAPTAKSMRCPRGGGSCAVESCVEEGACTMQRVTESASSVADEPFPYQKTFDAIAAATSVSAGRVAISVIKFREAFGASSVADAASDRNALFGRVTDWVTEHRIPFDAQNELFRIISAYVAANAENEQLRERIAELERDIELSQKLR